VSSCLATIRGGAALQVSSQQNVLFELHLEARVLHKTLIAFAAAATLGCLPMATTALAAHAHAVYGGHVARYGGGHGAGYGHVARYGGGYVNGPIYDSCADYGYGYGGCRGYGVPLVGGLVNGVLNGYGPY
jgi:hypothetical protein